LCDEFKHLMQLLCTRHGGAEKIVLPIEEFSQIEFHSVTGRCSERCQCPAAAQLADRFVEGCRTDTFNHNVNLFTGKLIVPVRFTVYRLVCTELQRLAAFFFRSRRHIHFRTLRCRKLEQERSGSACCSGNEVRHTFSDVCPCK